MEEHEAEAIRKTAYLSLRLGSRMIEHVGDALQDGRVSIWEGIELGSSFASLAMEIVPHVRELVESHVDANDIAYGLRALADKLITEEANMLFDDVDP